MPRSTKASKTSSTTTTTTRSTRSSQPATTTKPASIKKVAVKRGRGVKKEVEEEEEEEEAEEQEERKEPVKKETKVKKEASKKVQKEEEEEEDEAEEEEAEEEEVVAEAPSKRSRRSTAGKRIDEDMIDNNDFGLTWTQHDSILILSSEETRKGNKKVAAFDMDGTLIKTKSGRTFPVGRNDWVLLFPEVATKLRELHKQGYKIVIFTNQNGISTGTQPKAHITGKIQDLIAHFNIPIVAFVATADDLYRKPAVDMWTHFAKHYNGGVTVDLSQSWYVGDAAGRAKSWDGNANTKKDFSCGDRKFAHNIGLQFGTPEEFFLAQKAAPFSWGGVDVASMIPVEEKKDGGSHASATAKDAASSKDAQIVTGHGESATSAFTGSLHLGEVQEIVVFVGFPASGKSTFARKHFVPAGYVHVNQDTLKTKEKCVKVTRESVADGKSVVVDNTNGDPSVRSLYLHIAQDAGIRCRCMQFMTSMELSQHMNMFREKLGGVRHVSRIAYNVYKSKFRTPTTSEGFTEVKQINFVAQFDDDKAKQLFYQKS